METSLIPAVCKSMTENGVLSDNLRRPTISRIPSNLEQRLNLVAWRLWMDPIVDFWEMPPGWGVSGTALLQHTQGQCVVWLSDTDNSSSPLLVTTGWDPTHLWPGFSSEQKMEDLKKQCVCVSESNEQSYLCS